MCGFLNVPVDSQMSYADVCSGVVAYTRSQNLLKGQTIHPDARLMELFGLTPDNANLTFLNLQRHISPHLTPWLDGVDMATFECEEEADRKREDEDVFERRRGWVGGAKIFNSPHPISDALCEFLNVPAGSSLPRTTITRGLMTYMRSQNLMKGQRIHPDARLTELLGLTPDDAANLCILNLFKYIRPHLLDVDVAALEREEEEEDM
jgi:chromatin remodeling complex protein RSC6